MTQNIDYSKPIGRLMKFQLKFTATFLVLTVICQLIASNANAADKAYKISTFKKQTLTNEYHAESAHYADLDNDGHIDIIYGPYWFQGPNFKQKHTYYKPTKLTVKDYAQQQFGTFTGDFNSDGHTDILTLALPGGGAVWYENPAGKQTASKQGYWKKHLAFKNVDNESPMFEDINGDGKPEIICQSKGQFGYVTPSWDEPSKIWKFTPISTKSGRGRYNHGIGIGDVNGDGRKDLLEKNGWWQQPNEKNKKKLWQFHPNNFTRNNRGGAQMYTYDIDGDGDADIITSLEAHAWGLAWFEQQKQNGKITFKRHIIIDKKPTENPYGVAFSQMHALNLIDIDNDGLKDIVTGKRYFAHNGKDPGAHMPLVTVWFKLTRNAGKVEFVPHFAAKEKCGVGIQVETIDLNKDKYPEIIVGNKSGAHILWQQTKAATKTQWLDAQPKPINK